MSSSLRWGILATGFIADLFVRDLQLTGHVVQAVGSRSQAGADRFAAQFGIPNAHASYEALVSDPEVDIVYVSTPNPLHASNARLALNAGKHVLLEKPFTLNAPEAREIVDLAASRSLTVMEAMWTRFLPHMVRIREIIASGSLGEIYSICADHTRDLPPDPSHRLNALDLGGGALLDIGIYPISFAWDLLGAPTEIMAMARLKGTGVDAEVATMFRHGNGGISTTISSLDNNGPVKAMILGTKARIEIGPMWCTPTSFRLIDRDEKVLEDYSASVPGRGMQFQAVEMEALVSQGRRSSSIMPAEQSVGIMETMDAVRGQIGLRYPGE